MLQLFLPILQLLGSVLFSLQLPDVIHRRLQDGAFVPAHVPEDHRHASGFNLQVDSLYLSSDVSYLTSEGSRVWDLVTSSGKGSAQYLR